MTARRTAGTTPLDLLWEIQEKMDELKRMAHAAWHNTSEHDAHSLTRLVDALLLERDARSRWPQQGGAPYLSVVSEFLRYTAAVRHDKAEALLEIAGQIERMEPRLRLMPRGAA
jgi:hypothetical protein